VSIGPRLDGHEDIPKISRTTQPPWWYVDIWPRSGGFVPYHHAVGNPEEQWRALRNPGRALAPRSHVRPALFPPEQRGTNHEP